MSFVKKREARWILKTQNEDKILEIASYIEEYFSAKQKKPSAVPEEIRRNLFILLARLMYNRGFHDEEKIRQFFSVGTSCLHDPFLLPDMDKATERINKAIENHEKITIYGDYDVDGITSVSVLYKYFISVGATVDYYIPARTEEGYGLNEYALDKIKQSGTTLLVTVDTGTTAVTESQYASSIGIDIVITDHHECKVKQNEDGTITELIPDCIAVVNPKRPSGNYPFCDLAGVGVVFKLICALNGNVDDVIEKYGDLVAIGTIADIMPLINENRSIVVLGLKKLKDHASVGIKALLSSAGNEREINSSVIAYTVAPRINAAGRIGDPKTSIELLLETDYDKALTFANILCEENKRRQTMELEIFNDVEKIISQNMPDDKILIFESDKWHHGVIGIVASRIIERFNRPCILLCGDGENMKGSARSVKGVNIFELLQNVSDTLLKFGGHEMAAGLTLKREKYDEFREKLIEYANKNITDQMLVPSIETECEINFSDLNLRTYDAIRLLEPYGTGNQIPLFVVKNLKVVDLESIGNGKHIKMRLTSSNGNEEPITSLLFNKELNSINCTNGDEIDIICALNENIYNGKRSLTVNIKKFKLSNQIESADMVQSLFYDNFKKNGKVTDDILLTREIVVAVFREIRRRFTTTKEVNAFALARYISRISNLSIGYAKLLLSLDILTELGLISYSGNEIISVTYSNISEKVDLQLSETWCKVHRA